MQSHPQRHLSEGLACHVPGGAASRTLRAFLGPDAADLAPMEVIIVAEPFKYTELVSQRSCSHSSRAPSPIPCGIAALLGMQAWSPMSWNVTWEGLYVAPGRAPVMHKPP